MEENEEFTVSSFKNMQNTQSAKLKQLSLKSKHSHHRANYELEYKPESVALDVVSKGNSAINKLVTKERTLSKKSKKSEISPVSHAKHHQNDQNLIHNVQPVIDNIKEAGECLYNEEQKLESNMKNKNKLVQNYDSFSASNAQVYSKDEDKNNRVSEELGANVCSFPVLGETSSINESIIQIDHGIKEGDYSEENKMSLITKSKNDSINENIQIDHEGDNSEDNKMSLSTQFENDMTQDHDSQMLQTDMYNSMKHKHDCSENIGETCKSAEKRRYKFSSIKRRAGLLYKQIMNSKLNSVNSEYFLSKKNCSDTSKPRWIPPRSPYSLIQEDLFDKPWQLLIATIFLTKVSAKKALPQIHKFLKRWPRPEDLLLANEEDLYEYMKPLGLTVTRSHAIMRFTVEFLEKDWKYPRELYGIGKYGDDSYRMFCINEWRQVRPDDIPLNLYRNWLLENADALGIK